MSGESGDATELPSSHSIDIVPKSPSAAISALKESTRASVLEGLSTLLEQSLERSLSKKLDVRQQQKWFSVTAYLAQVMARIVRDLEFEKLRSEVDELKRQMDFADVVITTRALAEEGHKAAAIAATSTTSQDPETPRTTS